MLKLGWKAGTEQYAPSELLDYAMAAEEASFDSIDASDHFHPWAERGQAAVGADTIQQAICISADPEQHVRNARRYIDLGFNHLIFHSAGPDQRGFIEGYGREVLPRLRRSGT